MPEIPPVLLDNLPKIDVSGSGNVVVVALLMLFVVVAGYIFIKKNPLKKFPVTVKVNEHLKNGQINPEWTSGRSVGKVGEFQEYELKNGDKTKVPGYAKLERMGKKFFLELDKMDDGRYIPHVDRYVKEEPAGKVQETEVFSWPDPMDPKKTITKTETKEKELALASYEVSLTHDDTNWLIQTIRENMAKFSDNSFWSKYGFQLSIMIIIFASMMLLYVAVQYGAIPVIDRAEKMAGANGEIVKLWANETDKWIEHENTQTNLMLTIVKMLSEIRGINGTVIP
jgi:hypothetical protein